MRNEAARKRRGSGENSRANKCAIVSPENAGRTQRHAKGQGGYNYITRSRQGKKRI